MKQVLIIFLVVLLLPGFSLANDYTSMSDEKLKSEFALLQAEMINRSSETDKNDLDDILGISGMEKGAFFHSTGSLSDFELEQYCVLGGTAPVALVSFALQKQDIEELLGEKYIYHDYGFHREMVYGLCNFMGYWGNLVFSINDNDYVECIEIEGPLYVGGYNDEHTELIIQKIQRLTGIVPKIGHFEGVQYRFISPYIIYKYDSYNTRTTMYKERDKRRFNFQIYPGQECLSLNDKSWKEKQGLKTPFSENSF